MHSVRVGVVGAGSFGTNHLRVLSDMSGVSLVGVVDTDESRASEAANRFGCPALDLNSLGSLADAVVVATPTSTHASVGCSLLRDGLHVLVEKPIAANLRDARELMDAARENGRVLQIGHLERFNPAVQALQSVATLPLFFEIHRMSLFTPRSMDVDVVLDLMIHDVDILLALVGALPEEIRAAGIRILSDKVDIANVRLAFANGCIANLTASRASVEKIRKLRVFQPSEYLSLDYSRQDLSRVSVRNGEVEFASIPVEKQEPLRLELESFVNCIRTRTAPVVSAEEAIRALQVCLDILERIAEHGDLVNTTIAGELATVAVAKSS
ncbi:MAG: Gfo/Idh/MocA family oxidoreductase [Bryobacteraceae bacterium]|nr:Gfo/Idh/MocA family oxidoreductase [Bryobacteraceae bacterium]